MEDTITLAGLEGALLPLVLAFIMRAGWPDWARVLLSLAVYIAVGALNAFLNDDFTRNGLALSVGTVVGAGFIGFQQWRKLGITDRIERFTNGGEGHP